MIIGLAGVDAQSPVAPSKAKGALTVNIVSANYRDTDGTIVLRAVASNSGSRDGVITAAQLAHISMAPGGNVQIGYKQTGKLAVFAEIIVEAGKSRIFDIVSEVDLEDFYNDDLAATHLAPQERRFAREGRLFLELRTIDGVGKTYQNFFNIGQVGVYREGGKFVRPYVITDGVSLDAFDSVDFLTQIRTGLAARTAR